MMCHSVTFDSAVVTERGDYVKEAKAWPVKMRVVARCGDKGSPFVSKAQGRLAQDDFKKWTFVPGSVASVPDPPSKTQQMTAEAKAFLRNMVTAMEYTFADSTRYIADLNTLKLTSRDVPSVPPDFLPPQIVVTGAGQGWAATLTASNGTRLVCAIAVNGPNPLSPTAGDGSPECLTP